MKDEKQKTTKDKNGKLSTYVVVMLLSIIIVIIIAAMADDREQQFQSQIESTTEANMTIQTEIVTLKDQNYTLNQEKENLIFLFSRFLCANTACSADKNPKNLGFSVLKQISAVSFILAIRSSFSIRNTFCRLQTLRA